MTRHNKALQEIEEAKTFDAEPSVLEAFGLKNAHGAQRVHSDEALQLVNQVFLPRSEQAPRVVVFAGVDDSNGCNQISTSVAEILAADDERSVCLVDANFRSPAASGLAAATYGYGLTEALVSKTPIRSFFRPLDVRGNLWTLSHGPLNSGSPGMLTSGSLRERIDELRAGFDFVIIDTAPLRHYSDAIALAQLADGLVLIVEAGSTRRDETAKAVASLRASRVAILAAVLNNSVSPVPQKINNLL